jgi:hypothetical protein
VEKAGVLKEELTLHITPTEEKLTGLEISNPESAEDK